MRSCAGTKALRYKSSKLVFLTRNGEGSCRRGTVRECDPIFGPIRKPKAGNRASETCGVADSVSRATSGCLFNRNQHMGKRGLKPIAPDEIFGAIRFIWEVLGHNRAARA